MRTEQGMMSLELVESLVHYCVVVGPFMGARGSDSLTPRYTPPYVYPGLLFFFQNFELSLFLIVRSICVLFSSVRRIVGWEIRTICVSVLQ